ncbi:ABC transporter substrate-binding protein [Paenibacillus wulumuqiensis]|uniref:ABC transporter substrate-binding protein n=1 Tax=Paenibacillus wulumuqiensis TaxID=1567107 RepID=UPI000619E1DF|nr:ABC transporter substrate-binding protein [Paenibacillus wulumuqiensis]
MKASHFGLSILLVCTLAGCSQPEAPAVGSSASAAAGVAAVGAVSLTDFAGRTLSLQHTPERIVALSNGDVNIIYALGGTVVGRPTSTGSAPLPAAEKVQTIGSTHEIDLEKIAFLQPDVVLGNAPLNEKDIPMVESIGAQMVLSSANSVEDIQRQITLFGQMLQREDKARQLNETLKKHIQQLSASAKTAAHPPRVLLVYGAPGTYMAALPNSLSGNILELAGGTNIAADLPGLQNYPQYAQLNTERIVEADPDYVFIMTHGSGEEVKAGFLKEMQENQAWSSVSAVKNNRVDVLPSDLFGTNPGTRVDEALDLMHGLLYPDQTHE